MNYPKSISFNNRFFSHLLKISILPVFLCSFLLSNSQSEIHITVPNFDDSYCKAVKAIEAGITAIDYKKLRENFIESDQFKISYKSRSKMADLKRKLFEHRFHSRYDSIIKLSKKVLSLDYTDLSVHKTLEETYSKINDKKNAKKHRTIYTGLIESITNNKDGKSCKSAWPIVKVSEQYIILDELNCKVVKQEFDGNLKMCHKVYTDNNGIKATYHFDATSVAKAKKNSRTF